MERLRWVEKYKHFTFEFKKQTPDRFDVKIFRTRGEFTSFNMPQFITRASYETAVARAEFEAEVMIRREKKDLRRFVNRLEELKQS